MAKQRYKQNGQSRDLKFSWVVSERGQQWEDWRALMCDWLGTQNAAIDVKLRTLIGLLKYLEQIPDGHSPAMFFSNKNTLPDFVEMLCKTRVKRLAVRENNYAVDFFDWVIKTNFSEEDDRGRSLPLVQNPFDKTSSAGFNLTETVRNSLPYVYIKELRDILCPDPVGNFNSWEWAHRTSGQNRSDGRSAGLSGDWFEVDATAIDKSDPDCVWRIRTVLRLRKKVTIHEMWSPVRCVALYIKLHLPLRTYQVRFLDSGEADTWRYSQGNWELNAKHDFKAGTEKNPYNRGVFCRIRSAETGELMTGLYVSTNKTADQNKDATERGYTIPWQHKEVIYWLEKLRNWQEKYNPINSAQPCLELGYKHFDHIKSDKAKREMGDICFLFRDPADKNDGRAKPIDAASVSRLWSMLLDRLENQVFARGQTLGDGSRMRFVKARPGDGTRYTPVPEFPLHSLRVSLLTCYAMEGQVPMPVLSKLLAGHSRLLMTLYYIKLTPAVMSQAMQSASAKIDQAQEESLRTFLRDADLRQITCKTAYRDETSLQSALANRNPVGWEHRHIGICLAGGNTYKVGELSTAAGCWNGGECIGSTYWGPVPNGPENCVRCRWFITDASHLDALRAHFNNISYKASLAANLAVEHEQVRDTLLDARYLAVERGSPFLQQQELQEAERRYEKQIALADQCAKDLVACFQLIGRLITIEEGRAEDDVGMKIVAVGSMQDIHQPISFIEVNSELLQLSQICEDAEIYPDLADDLRKTPAIEKRSRALNNLLMQNGYAPIFMQMDDRMQLIAGNAMMRKMARHASPSDQLEGYRYVAGIVETGKKLHLLAKGIEALEEVFLGPVIKLSDLITSDRSDHGGVARG